MKQLIIAAMALAGLVSCDKSEIIPAAPVEAGTEKVLNITFTNDKGYVLTRGYFDGTTEPEPWEKKITSMEVFICDSSGDIMLRRTLSDDEIARMQFKLSIPQSTRLERVTTVCIANYQTPLSVQRLNDLQNMLDNLPAAYNSVGEASSPGEKWNSGFTMSALAEITDLSTNPVPTVEMTLRRTVAKIAVRVAIDPQFTANHSGGMLEITKASVVRAAADGKVIWRDNPNEVPTSMTFNHTVDAVKSETVKEFVFYVHPNHRQNWFSETNPAIRIEGLFDRDGDPATRDDIFNVSYEVFINKDNYGAVVRNEVYKYDLTVKGLNGAQVESAFEVNDWTPPVTEDFDAGN